MVAQVFMTSAGSELLLAVIRLTALQARFGLLVVEIAALSIGQMPNSSQAESNEPGNRTFDAEVGAAARAIKARLLGGKEGGSKTCFGLIFRMMRSVQWRRLP
jgi:hypothetical protein